MFEAQVGLTPREFAAGRRAERVRTRLAEGERVTGALYGAGFGSSGRFYEAAAGILGMEPSRYRSGGAGLDIAHAVLPCSLGLVLAAATARGVCAILLGEDRSCLTRDLARRFPRARLVEATPGFARVLEAVVKLVDDPRRGLDLPLDVRGTAFQERVWRALRAVPAGRTVTYTELARAAGAPRAVRAAAAACAANPLAVAIPCHRAVRGDGGLAGYRWGLPRKRRLLAAEAEDRSVKG
jgi:AraC family transcriptional regulator of adaptative response/methylated-DNA-[protein]-cysteine methyltransferase